MGQIIDQAIRLYRRNLFKFIAIIALAYVPLTVLQTGISMATLQRSWGSSSYYAYQSLLPTETLIGLASSAVVGLLTLLLVHGLAAAALAGSVAEQYLGRVSTVWSAYRWIGRRWKSLLGALLIAILLYLGVGVWTVVPCIGWLTGPGILILFSQAVLPLIAPVVVLEGQPAGAAVRRAWDLLRRRFWWVIGFVGILFLFGMLILAGPQLIASTILTLSTESIVRGGDYLTTQLARTAIQSLVTMLLNLLYLPLQITCMVLLYFDLRVRTEGFDLAVAAEVALGGPEAAAEALAQRPPPAAGPVITWTEVGNFALISLGLAAFVALLYGLLFLIALIILGLAGAL